MILAIIAIALMVAALARWVWSLWRYTDNLDDIDDDSWGF